MEENLELQNIIEQNIGNNFDKNPKLICNNFKRGEKVLSTLIEELNSCESFYFSVAFLTMSGVQVLLDTFKSLQTKCINGIIILSEYQNFTEPKAIKRLKQFNNIEVRIVTQEVIKMHTKAFIFKKSSDIYTVMIGSSNLTQNALCCNLEWNVKINSLTNAPYTKMIIEEFEEIKEQSILVSNDWLQKYEQIYKQQLEKRQKLINLYNDNDFEHGEYLPNSMQIEALENLKKLRDLSATKSLVISATGTGKTILAAFDVKRFKPKKFLFIVHRATIAKAAMESFKKIIGNNLDASLMVGGTFKDATYIFAMIQTFSKQSIYKQFKPDEFDYIIIDEVHRAGAKSYQDILDYFKPKFLLGMTATPERSDGIDIFKLFDYNIAYEIRLEQAIENDLICPFHYYGISEIEVNGKVIDDFANFKNLVSDERVKNIIEKINFYGYSGNRVKGLIFVSRTEEARLLSESFNQRGFKTVFLDGTTSQDDREKAITLLEFDDPENCLQYIFTVDIFNEGVDIPSINQIVLLRPTQSAIIFVQQIGRGLRKYNGKEYVNIIDFIGNYEQNFLIPIALSGYKENNKDKLRKFIFEGNNLIPGASTISFDEIAKQRIFASIDQANLSSFNILKKAYFSLKQKIGRIPTLEDFENHDSIDVMLIFNNKTCNYSFYDFLHKVDAKNYLVRFNEEERKILSFIGKKYIYGKRPHELEFINLLLDEEIDVIAKFREVMSTKYPNLNYTNNTEICVINQMTQTFLVGSEKETFKNIVFIEKSADQYIISKFFQNILRNLTFKHYLKYLIDFGLKRYQKYYKDNLTSSNFKMYEKYTYEDVCRLLDWHQNQVATNIGGYKFDEDTNTFPIFINYVKSEGISSSINYEDKFYSPQLLKAISKSNRTESSPEIKRLKKFEEVAMTIPLFVRKNKDDKISKEFYYFGNVKPLNNYKEIQMSGDEKIKAVEISYELETPVREDIYNYITK